MLLVVFANVAGIGTQYVKQAVEMSLSGFVTCTTAAVLDVCGWSVTNVFAPISVVAFTVVSCVTMGLVRSGKNEDSTVQNILDEVNAATAFSLILVAWYTCRDRNRTILEELRSGSATLKLETVAWVTVFTFVRVAILVSHLFKTSKHRKICEFVVFSFNLLLTVAFFPFRYLVLRSSIADLIVQEQKNEEDVENDDFELVESFNALPSVIRNPRFITIKWNEN